MEKAHFVVTGDGSKTLYQPAVGEHYHSKHGARQESEHVFLGQGLQHFLLQNPAKKSVSILEVGFGTGLNFLLTADFVSKETLNLKYCGVEANPLPLRVIQEMGYDQFVEPEVWGPFIQQYPTALEESVNLNEQVELKIAHEKILDFSSTDGFDVVYFDAFAAIHQPEMWTDGVLTHVANQMNVGGVFVTYAITGNLKRSMKALGFSIEKAPGAPGKREMLRATKL